MPHAIAGKRLVVVDDSIVRGSTTRKIVEMLRDAGALEVHLRVSAPPIISPCFYGIDMAKHAELIAAGRSLDEIRELLGADSLAYLSLDGLQRAIGTTGGALLPCLPDRQLPRAGARGCRQQAALRARARAGMEFCTVSHPFCGHCSRIRITSDGKIRTCLFSVWDHDLHELMARGASDENLSDFIRDVVQKKEERHHIGEADFVPASRTMVHIGG